VTSIELVRERLRNQMLAGSRFRKPGDVVAWLGAVQAQDYAGAKWALGLRATGLTAAAVERAFDDGGILRTHCLRPTWHFVTPADIRWMLALSAPRVHAVNAFIYRQLELDAKVFARSRAALERALRGGTQMTRLELAQVLQRASIPAKGLRLAYLVMRAELDAVICSGARRGKQFTYALLEERVPPARALTRDEALAELTRRYFSSHGPATLRDYGWWSGLTGREARTGIEMVGSTLTHTVIDGRSHWFVRHRSQAPSGSVAHLLPNYDEYLIAYKDREAVVGPASGNRRPDVFAHSFLIDGVLAGSWKRTVKGDSVLVEAVAYSRLTPTGRRALEAAAARLGKFVNLAVEVVSK
jgi:hypothetical protein